MKRIFERENMLSWARENVEIARIDSENFDQKTFDEKYLKLNRPVIISNMGRDLECSKWTLERLKKLTNPIQVRHGL